MYLEVMCTVYFIKAIDSRALISSALYKTLSLILCITYYYYLSYTVGAESSAREGKRSLYC